MLLSYQKKQHRSVLVNSANRDTVQFPNPNSYQILMPWNLERVHVAYLCTAVFVVPAGPPLTANLRVRELESSGKVHTTWTGGQGSTLACIPVDVLAGARLAYQPSDPTRIDVIRTEDSTYFPSFATLSLSWTDENGALIANMTEHVIRLMFESVYSSQ